MYNKLTSEPTDCHGLDIGVWDFASDSTEQAHKRRRFKVIKVAIGQ